MPVPLAPRRLRLRGYNQAAILARQLGEAWELPVAEDFVRRKRETATQTTLTPEQRTMNVHSAFAAARPTVWPASARPAIILIDDVLTTGATLGAAAQALADAGWASVSALTFTRAVPFATGW